MSGFVARENRERTASYRKDETLEAALLEINQTLAAREPDPPADLDPAPHIFVFGLPRSGTTLAHQVLAWGLDVGYVTNVMARFWLAPHAGAVVSQAVLGETRDGSFASDYGKSRESAGGHEFAYFWQRWLGIDDVDDLLDFSGDSAKADWTGAAASVARIRAVLDRPLLFKTNYAAQFLPAFARTFPMPIFVHVVRDPLAVGLSILEARRRYYGDVATWWATYPPEYARLVGRSPAEQVAGQVVGLRRAYDAQAAKTPRLTVEIAYEELCADPRAAVQRVRERCREMHGATPSLLRELPARFELSQPPGPATSDEVELAALLRKALA